MNEVGGDGEARRSSANMSEEGAATSAPSQDATCHGIAKEYDKSLQHTNAVGENTLNKAIKLSQIEDSIHISKGLKDKVATRVLELFGRSLNSTLLFAGSLLLIDAIFIYVGTIKPEQRLMTETVVMTFITATVVQVGSALAAIVFAVFRNDA